MTSDIANEDLAARIASIRVQPPEDRIDLDEAVRAGAKRRWHQQAAAAGAFGCVTVAAAAAFLLSPSDHGANSATSASGVPRPAVAAASPRPSSLPADQIRGRWLAVTVDGKNVSAWRDIGGLPANIIIGADGMPGQWQANLACGPLAEGDFVLRQDGSFSEPSPPTVLFASCPELTTPTPDLVGVIGRTAFVAIDQAGNSPSRTMRFLDRHRKVIALWREDTTIKSFASVCERALGGSATSEGAFTTLEQIRSKSETPSVPSNILPNVPGGRVLVYCAVGGPAGTQRYAVTADGQKVKL